MDTITQKTFFEKRKKALLWLKHDFPGAFPAVGPVPLKVGIHVDLLACAFEHAPSKIIIRRTLHFYVHGPSYLRAMVSSAPRFDLDGLVVGEVSEKEALIAKHTLKKLYTTAKPLAVKKNKEKIKVASPALSVEVGRDSATVSVDLQAPVTNQPVKRVSGKSMPSDRS